MLWDFVSIFQYFSENSCVVLGFWKKIFHFLFAIDKFVRGNKSVCGDFSNFFVVAVVINLLMPDEY